MIFMNKPLQFKQFAIEHEIIAMKVETDGIFLGACVNLE